MHDPVATFGIAMVVLAFYFIPTAIACQREHPSSLAIFFTNLFFGWSLIGWIIALIWAGTGAPKEATR